MAVIIEKWRGICANIAGNNNKFWEIELDDCGNVTTRWGRIEEAGKAQSKVFPFAGKGFFDKKIREKKNKSNPDERYTEARTVESTPGSTQTKVVQSSNLVEIAKREINSNSADTIALIERLAAANIHNIVSQTTMTFNKVTGLFETSLGVVDNGAILEARLFLTTIGDSVAKQDWSTSSLTSAINQYMRLIPSDFGRAKKTPHDIFPDLSAVQKQNDILDSLDASLQMMIATPVTDSPAKAAPKLFETTLHLVDDAKVFDKINKLYADTRQSMHSASRLNVHKIYKVEIAKMDKEFREHGLKIGNIMELWHGSRVSNLLSILKGGFMVPPSNSSHCTGRMYGPGVYMSDQSTKALNYAIGAAPGMNGRSEQFAFMFLNDCAMGRYLVPSGPTSSRPPSGYDSYFAQAGKSGVYNNEMIVPETFQVNPRYLVEFK